MYLGEFNQITSGIKTKIAKVKLFSYLPFQRNILEYRHWYGGDELIHLCRDKYTQTEEKKSRAARGEFLNLLEKAKLDWQFSIKLMAEITDTDLIDYVVYLVKANEARYRYLLKIARKEKITCEMWRQEKVHDI